MYFCVSNKMNIEEFREHCVKKKGVAECFPFDETTLVFKVMGKMFALTSLEKAFGFSVKTIPEEGAGWREQYTCIQPAWHMNKTHWIMVTPDGSLDDATMKLLIDRSYEVVVSGLTKKLKTELEHLPSL
jgi:predicted DNA-binding protein (MmcQ/YjbR family)